MSVLSSGKPPVRSRAQAHYIADRLITRQDHYTRVDNSDCWGVPATGIHIKNKYGEELITWDSFRELWLRNVECDEKFVTKPFLARK